MKILQCQQQSVYIEKHIANRRIPALPIRLGYKAPIVPQTQSQMESSIVVEIVKGAFALLKQSLENMRHDYNENDIQIESHIQDCISWSSKIQFFGMPRSENLDENSIELSVSSTPRKFSHIGEHHSDMSEYEILSKNENFVLLGGPGSGKTTTIKRLVRTLFSDEPKSHSDTYQYPIVLRLRETNESEPLSLQISKLLGVTIKYKSI